MDPKTVEWIERRLEERARARGEGAAPDDGPPLYLQDLEARAKKKGFTVDEVYRRDTELLAGARPTPDCLRAEGIMQAALDAERLPKPDYEHLQSCPYCRAQAAASVPDARRHAAMMEELADHEPPRPLPIERRTAAIFRGVDRFAVGAVKVGSRAAAACFFLFAFVTLFPNVRTRGPNWAWSDRQLQDVAAAALKAGDAGKADALTSELIKREPVNPGWYILRSQARQKAGLKLEAKEDLESANRLLKMAGADNVGVVERTSFREGDVPIKE